MNPTNTTPSPTDTGPALNPPVNGIKKFVRNRRAMAIVAGVVVVVLGLMAYSVWQQNRQTPTQATRPWNTEPKFNPNQVVATVGDEKIYGDDLNYILDTNYPDSTQSAETLKNEALDLAAVESALLQQGQHDGLIKLSESVFNNATKDQSAREDLLRDIRKQVREKSDRFTTSAVSVWFYNVDAPQVSPTQAEQIARAKINQLYPRIQSNSLSMIQAADEIKKDTSLARVDRNYQGNAYILSENWDRDNPAFTFDELNEAALNLKEGQVSSVIRISDIAPNHREEFFVVLKMEKRFDGQFRSLGEWTKMAEEAYSLK